MNRIYILFLLMVVLVFGCKMRGCPSGLIPLSSDNRPSPIPKDYSKIKCISVGADEFSRLSEKNQYTFNRTYGRKCVDVTGVFEGSGNGEASISGYRKMEERDARRMVGIRCDYDNSVGFTNLVTGQRITVRGILSTLDSTPTAPLLVNCVLVK